MGLDLVTVLAILGLTLLGVLLTGPGMWSEKWGWSALRRRKSRRSGRAQTDGDAAGEHRHAARGSGEDARKR